MGGGVLEGGVEDLLRGDGVAEGVAVVVELDGDGGGGDAIGVVFWGKGAGGRDVMMSWGVFVRCVLGEDMKWGRTLGVLGAEG